MADPVTPNYGFNLPAVGGDDNAWGDLLNANWSSIDAALWSVSGVASAALTPTTGDARYLKLTGGTLGPNSFIVNGPAQFNNYTNFTGAQPTAFSTQAQFTGGATFGTAQVFFNSQVTFSADALMVTPAAADNSQRAATTAWVHGAIAALPAPPAPATTPPLMDGTAAVGTSALYARGDHVHPTDTSRFAVAGGTLTGGLTAPAVAVNGAAGAYRSLNFNTNGVLRWALGEDNAAESGSNAGSNFFIARYNDAGAGLGTPVSINRANGGVTIGTLSVSGSLTANSGILCGSNGVTYSGLGGGNMIGFTWASPLVNLFVDAVAQGNIVTGRSGSGLTAVYAFSVNGTNSQAQATYPGGGFTWPVTFSDPALKGDVAPASKDALAAIMGLKVWEYDYLSPFPDAEPQHWDWGLMADDELSAIMPPAFIPATPIPGIETYAQIRELPIIAALVKAVQQLTARVETLEAQLKGAT